jgi:transcriptional regulator with XRE-family HTH domain
MLKWELLSKQAMDAKELGQRLKKLREKCSMTQTEVAKVLGLTSAALSQYESGGRNISALLLQKIARIYGVTTAEIFLEDPTALWIEQLRKKLNIFLSIQKKELKA